MDVISASFSLHSLLQVRIIQKEDRAVKNDSVEGRVTYWDPKLGDVEVYLRTSKDGTVFTYMENGHMEEASENSKGVYQGHISGRIYYLK